MSLQFMRSKFPKLESACITLQSNKEQYSTENQFISFQHFAKDITSLGPYINMHIERVLHTDRMFGIDNNKTRQHTYVHMWSLQIRKETRPKPFSDCTPACFAVGTLIFFIGDLLDISHYMEKHNIARLHVQSSL